MSILEYSACLSYSGWVLADLAGNLVEVGQISVAAGQSGAFV